MTVVLDAPNVERFRRFLSNRFGFHLDETKFAMLADLLRRRVEASGKSAVQFLDSLEAVDAGADLRAIVAEVTVPETYFFRNIDQFRAFTDVALVERLRARAPSKQLRLLSAGCASGEEPYSLAISIRQAALDPSWNVSILGVDLNQVVLEKAARGRFTPWALRETPDDVRRRWFHADGADLVLDEEIRSAVRFEQRNLVDRAAAPWAPGSFDVIFWRNVMMYFTPQDAQAVLARLTRALAPGGYLFLGHAETLRGISNDFHLRHTHGTFYYQRRLDDEPRQLPAPIDCSLAGSAGVETLSAVFEAADSWVDTIQKASQRIGVLADASEVSAAPVMAAGPPMVASAPVASAPVASAPVASAPAWNLARVLALLEKEQFADALGQVRALPPESARDPQVLLLRAALLTHSGQLAEAEEACAELLAVDELDAGAHYLLALCREGAGDRRAATDHDQIAAYLDPGFAMPRLHLGLLSRRANNRESARHDLGHALVLLQREDASRLMLFGGGFGREALVALCRAELVACGGTP
ncbi:MAG: chemotaxis protein methyltransferase CheR [Myxococcales bacterium]|nr:chemotaxis protein methyltransferase CheR [Myxococcales bacterium]